MFSSEITESMTFNPFYIPKKLSYQMHTAYVGVDRDRNKFLKFDLLVRPHNIKLSKNTSFSSKPIIILPQYVIHNLSSKQMVIKQERSDQTLMLEAGQRIPCVWT